MNAASVRRRAGRRSSTLRPPGAGRAVDAQNEIVARRRVVGRSAARALLAVVLVVALYATLPVESASDVGALVRTTIGVVLVAVAAVWEVRAVAKARFPAIRAIDALAVTVSLMVTVFATLYLNLSSRDAGAFNEPLGRTSALYFTLVTLTTVGYGDIAARTDGARIAVMVQLVFNVAVIGTTVRLIVGTAKRRRVTVADPER